MIALLLEKELKEHINTQFESRNLNPAYLIKYRYMLNDKLNVSYSNHVEQLKLYYDQLHLTDFVASVFFAFLGTLANIGFLTHIISSTVASYILIPTVILSFVYGSVIIAKKHAHNERLYSLNTAMNALNIGYLFLSAASVAITSIYLQTSLMPLSIISCFISLGASYIHRFTTFNAVIPKEVEPLVDKDMLTYVGEKNSKI